MNEKDCFRRKTKDARDCSTILLDKATNVIGSQFTVRSKAFLRFFKSNGVNFYSFLTYLKMQRYKNVKKDKN